MLSPAADEFEICGQHQVVSRRAFASKKMFGYQEIEKLSWKTEGTVCLIHEMKKWKRRKRQHYFTVSLIWLSFRETKLVLIELQIEHPQLCKKRNWGRFRCVSLLPVIDSSCRGSGHFISGSFLRSQAILMRIFPPAILAFVVSGQAVEWNYK